jgi:hypothetical protein
MRLKISHLKNMKKTLSILLLSLCLSTVSHADSLDFNNAEDQLHLSAGFAVNLTAYSILREETDLSQGQALLYSTGGTILLGILKESLSSSFSKSHIEAVGLGAATAIVIPVMFNF